MPTMNTTQSANKPTQPAAATVKAEPDPASALGDLRARALQSKSRRPKHPHTAHIPPPLTQRTRPPADLILDYTGDGLGVQPHLEEGEIGDMHTGMSAGSQSAPSAAEIPGFNRQKSSTPTQRKRPPTIKQESPPHSAQLYPRIQQDVDMENPGRTNTIDEFHVRPGLALSQSQYDACKDIVLDLLGWGVTPEYLAQCGLSREIIFFTFTELNLRLPANLDTTGLSPFDPTAPREPSSATNQPPAAPDLAAIEREMRLAVQMRKKKNQPPSPPVLTSTQFLSPTGGATEAEQPSNDAEAFLNSIVPPTFEPIDVDDTIRRPSEPPTPMAPPPTTPPDVVRPPSTSTAGPSQPRPELFNRRRPTAADYVDESQKGKSGNILVRNKTSSFAGIKRPAKMVIDLSDTESEAEDDPMDGSAVAASSSSKSTTPRLTESKSLLDVESSLAKAKEELQLRILSRQSRRPTIENPVPPAVKPPQDMVTASSNTTPPPASGPRSRVHY
ncbi:hypothetical protein CYLTODRAFT_80088 [Cylindrobasidium torrendii FP15055 ss-10]|uniref:Uncharacterized protein n=1 Tax=Cylindrobasidium torrendii FP15055 ss-10 TaxID=1314674 RepID=A0A0D7BP58_9AGAR|nr:hypothetical protein CYLTODRAFT_80088 [Cylindrobasidium torrendii FP15055 ss-10]